MLAIMFTADPPQNGVSHPQVLKPRAAFLICFHTVGAVRTERGDLAMTAGRPFHAGELAVQKRAGESLAGESNGTMISNTVMRGARAWLRQQTLVVLASRDPEGAM
jgi:hypothetical protein